MAAVETLRLEVLTPTKSVFDGEVASFSLATARGRIEIHPDHAAMVAVVGVGPVELELPTGGSYELAVHGGIMQIQPGVPARGEEAGEPVHVQVLAKEGEHPRDIDLSRAEAALTRASETLAEDKENSDMGVLQDRLRAEARIGAFKSFRSHHEESEQ